MMRRIVMGGILTLALGTGCSSSRTQERVVVAPPPRVTRREPVREVIVVERTHVPKGHAYGWWKQHGYREVTVYYDGTRYYGHRHDSALRAVIVFQRDGKYYVPDADEERGERGRSRHGNGQGKDD
jgi:hypothetical protein